VAAAQAALAAVARNSAIVLPFLNRPFHIDGSWKARCRRRQRAAHAKGLPPQLQRAPTCHRATRIEA
jgi:hypothetical protein